MKAKVLVVVSSGREAKEKALTGLMYATNAVRNNWADVKLILFGPVEDLVAENDPDTVSMIEEYSRLSEKPLACRRIAEMKNYVEKIEDKTDAVYVGKIISDLIAEGYTPLVF